MQIQIAGRSIEISAEQLHGTARQEAWRHITGTADRFATYEQRTDREIPVIRLRSRPAPRRPTAPVNRPGAIR